MNSEVVLNRDTMIVSETNTKGKIIYANEDFCTIAGYTKDELIGKPHNVLRHKDMPRAAFKDLWDHMKEGKLWKGLVKNITKDGDYYWVNATVYTVIKRDGEKRLISVRIKPTKKEIEDAIALYKTLD